ncbi:MAG TPA: hypothetical protein PKK26_10705 [Candidatus Wallbacteria bacterium]|nr:hypothetical protein [Candidatus Wallbacteria bacterium]
MLDKPNNEEKTLVQKGLEFFIPGYKGYRESESIIEADSKVRAFIVRNIGELIAEVDAVKKKVMVKAGGLKLLPCLENVTSVLKKVSSQVQFAGSASAGFSVGGFTNENCVKLKTFDEGIYFSLQEVRKIVEDQRADDGYAKLDEFALKISAWADSFSGQLRSRNELIKN